jgi:hypothetical protein
LAIGHFAALSTGCFRGRACGRARTWCGPYTGRAAS